MYQYFVTRYGYTNEEITIINKYSKHMGDEDKEIVESLYKIDVLVYSVILRTEFRKKFGVSDFI